MVYHGLWYVPTTAPIETLLKSPSITDLHSKWVELKSRSLNNLCPLLKIRTLLSYTCSLWYDLGFYHDMHGQSSRFLARQMDWPSCFSKNWLQNTHFFAKQCFLLLLSVLLYQPMLVHWCGSPPPPPGEPKLMPLVLLWNPKWVQCGVCSGTISSASLIIRVDS